MVLRRPLPSGREWALALVLASVIQVEAWSSDVPLLVRAVIAAAGFGMALALPWRMRAPLGVLLVAVSVAFVFWVVGGAADEVTSFGIALLIAVYSGGAHTSGRRAVVAAFAVVALAVISLVEDGGDFDLAGILFFAILFGGPWLAGRAIRHHRERERALEELALQLEHEREEKARAAVAEERIRIARELHDVVAHAISVVIVQARGGRRSLAGDPREAREAFDCIERTGGQALEEMRRLLGVLRKDDEEIALAPQPSLRFLDALLSEVRRAGLPVDLAVEGEPRVLAPGVDLSAYRIVQEALTNALKHAGPASARVVVRYGQKDVEVEVVDNGSGTGKAIGGGHGLAGMRERVSLFGGELEAGRRNGQGFAVRARLPLSSARG